MRYNPLLHGNANRWDDERKHHKGGGGGGTSTTKMEPAAEVKPYLKPYMDWSWSQTRSPYQAYQGQKVSELAPEQYMGMGLTSAQALNGFQGQGEGMGNFQSTLRGDFMNPDSNPWLRANMNAAMSDITSAYRAGTKPTTDAAFSRQGAFGGSAWNQAVQNNERQLADSLGRTANEFLGSNYSMERGNQMNAMGMMPTMQNLGYTDAQKLTGVGDALRGYNQDLLNSNYQDWQEAQNYPFKMMDIFGNQLRATMGGAGGTTTTSNSGYQASPIAGMLGGGMAGYGMGQMMGFNPMMGAGLGAIGGLL